MFFTFEVKNENKFLRVEAPIIYSLILDEVVSNQIETEFEHNSGTVNRSNKTHTITNIRSKIFEN